jgi:hypothetical protein
MLFFLDGATTETDLSGGIDPGKEGTSGGNTATGLLKKLDDAAKQGSSASELFRTLTAIEDKAMTLQKTMSSGLVLGGEQFREKLEQIYLNTQDVGIQFKDVTDLIGGLSKGVGLLIEPEKEVVEQMVLLAQNTGIAKEAMGGMVADFMKLTFSQTESMNMIDKITEKARKAGVNVNTTLTNIQKNLSKVDAYGFKNGVDGLAKMTIQAQQLKTTVEDIGAAQLGQTFWDPEKAIEAAAGMSMLGGSMSDLMNPFQLMNMGANDVEKLQEKLIDLSASAFKVDEATGKVETNFIAQQRLKQQLESMGKGGDYEKFVNMGREAAKQAQIIEQLNKSGLGSLFEAEGGAFTEEDQRLIASLSEVGKDGKISLNIPGQEGITDLKDALRNPAGIKDALTEYQAKAAMSEREIAQKSLSTVDNIDAQVKMISQTLLRTLSGSERSKVLSLGGDSAVGSITYAQTKTKDFAKEVKKEVGNKDTWDSIFPNPNIDLTNDGFFGDGRKRLMTGKGEMFNFIEDDQALFAPNLDEKLGVLKSAYLKLKQLNVSESLDVKINAPKTQEILSNKTFEPKETLSKKETKTEQTVVQKVEGSGTININVNITSSGNLADTLMSDRRFKNQLETEILTTMKNKDILMVKKP